MMNRTELIQYVEENKELDFIANIVTPFQLIGVEAFLRKYFKKEKRVHGVYLIAKHSRNDYLLSENDIRDLSKFSCDIFVYSEERTNKMNKLSLLKETLCFPQNIQREKELLIIYPGQPWTFFSAECMRKTKYRIIDIVTDDGIASYDSIWVWSKNIAKENRSLLFGIQYFLRRYVSYIVNWFYKIPINCYSLFDKKSFCNSEIAECYKKVFEEKKVIGNFEFDDNAIIYISQPFPDEEFQKKITKIAESLLFDLNRMGYKIYVKKHPREEKLLFNSALQCVYLSDKYVIEDIVAKSCKKPQIVLGWTSTALFTLSSFWNIDCYTLCDKFRNGGAIVKNFMKIMKESGGKVNHLHYSNELIK